MTYNQRTAAKLLFLTGIFSFAEIAELLHLPEAAVIQTLTQPLIANSAQTALGIQPKRPPRPETAVLAKAIAGLSAQGMKTVEIANQLGISRQRVHYYLSKTK